jgi:hypothetical protein
LQYVFIAKAGQILGFMSGGTGVSRALVQMVGLRLGGDGCGKYYQKLKPLLCGDCNMFLVAKAGQILGF